MLVSSRNCRACPHGVHSVPHWKAILRIEQPRQHSSRFTFGARRNDPRPAYPIPLRRTGVHTGRAPESSGWLGAVGAPCISGLSTEAGSTWLHWGPCVGGLANAAAHSGWQPEPSPERRGPSDVAQHWQPLRVAQCGLRARACSAVAQRAAQPTGGPAPFKFPPRHGGVSFCSVGGCHPVGGPRALRLPRTVPVSTVTLPAPGPYAVPPAGRPQAEGRPGCRDLGLMGPQAPPHRHGEHRDVARARATCRTTGRSAPG